MYWFWLAHYHSQCRPRIQTDQILCCFHKNMRARQGKAKYTFVHSFKRDSWEYDIRTLSTCHVHSHTVVWFFFCERSLLFEIITFQNATEVCLQCFQLVSLKCWCCPYEHGIADIDRKKVWKPHPPLLQTNMQNTGRGILLALTDKFKCFEA